MEGGNIFGLGGGVRHLQQAVGGDAEMFFEFAGLPGGGDGDLLGVVDFPAVPSCHGLAAAAAAAAAALAAAASLASSK